MAKNSSEFKWPVRVYIEDTDAGGIVYYVNYLKFLERARTEFMRSVGYGKNFIAEQGLMFVVHSLQANFKQPAQLDDELMVTALIVKKSGASMVFAQQVLRDGVVMFEATIKVACVCCKNLKPKLIPKELLNSVV